ncbi:MAG TPA: hypothetical protein VGB95_03425 [Chitinophagales bacterium]
MASVTFQLDENDFLTSLLFLASKSDQIKKIRQRNKIVIPLLYVGLGLLLGLWGSDIGFLVTFLVVGFLWFLLYPLWEKRRYVNHYKQYIQETYKERIGKNMTVEFNNEFVVARDSGSETKTLTTVLDEINEISSLIILRMKSGQTFILPKDKIMNVDSVIVELKDLAACLKIQYIVDEKWEWK